MSLLRLKLGLILALVVSLTLSGCAGQLDRALDQTMRQLDPTASPHPVLRDQEAQARLAIVLSATAIHVSPPTGMEGQTGRFMAEQMASILQEKDVPALTGKAPKNARYLTGEARIDRVKGDKALIVMEWTITNKDRTYRDGFAHEEIVTIADPDRIWETMPPSDLIAFVRKSAGRIAGEQEEVAVAKPRPQQKALPDVCLEKVHGAPGDGNALLTQAMSFQLSMRKVNVTELVDHCLLVAGTVAVEPVEGRAEDQVHISWIVLDQSGAQVGTVDQENRVPEGSLNGSWKQIAQPIAGAAVDGVLALVRQSANP